MKSMPTLKKETGEIMDVEAYDNLALAREEKRRNIALLFKNRSSDVDELKREKAAIVARFDARINRAENTCKWCKATLEKEFSEPYEEADYKISFRQSAETIIDDVKKIPDEYCNVSRTPKKAEIKAAIKAGKNIDGARVESKRSIVIK